MVIEWSALGLHLRPEQSAKALLETSVLAEMHVNLWVIYEVALECAGAYAQAGQTKKATAQLDVAARLAAVQDWQLRQTEGIKLRSRMTQWVWVNR